MPGEGTTSGPGLCGPRLLSILPRGASVLAARPEDGQGGARPAGHSCLTQLLTFWDTLLEELEQGRGVGVVCFFQEREGEESPGGRDSEERDVRVLADREVRTDLLREGGLIVWGNQLTGAGGYWQQEGGLD